MSTNFTTSALFAIRIGDKLVVARESLQDLDSNVPLRIVQRTNATLCEISYFGTALLEGAGAATGADASEAEAAAADTAGAPTEPSKPADGRDLYEPM